MKQCTSEMSAAGQSANKSRFPDMHSCPFQCIWKGMNFSDALVAAVTARGTILAVADLIGVEPQSIYRWIAGVDLPDEKEQARLLARLKPVPPA